MQTEGKTYEITDEELQMWYSLLNDSDGQRSRHYYGLLKKYPMPAWGIESLDEPLTETEKFKTVYAFNGVICTVENYDYARHILRQIYSSIDDEGGTLLIDIPAQWEKLKNAGDKVWQIGRSCTDPASGKTFSYSYYDEVDYIEQLYTTYFRYEVAKGENILAVKTDKVRMRWYGIHEFQTLLLEAGFKTVSYQTVIDDGNSCFIMYTAQK